MNVCWSICYICTDDGFGTCLCGPFSVTSPEIVRVLLKWNLADLISVYVDVFYGA